MHNKVTATAVASALTALIVGELTRHGVSFSAEEGGAITTLIGFAIGWAVPGSIPGAISGSTNGAANGHTPLLADAAVPTPPPT